MIPKTKVSELKESAKKKTFGWMANPFMLVIISTAVSTLSALIVGRGDNLGSLSLGFVLYVLFVVAAILVFVIIGLLIITVIINVIRFFLDRTHRGVKKALKK